MGRRKKENPLSQQERLARSRELLLETGGRRLEIRLSNEAVAYLSVIMETHGFETKKQAVEWALALAGTPGNPVAIRPTPDNENKD